MRHDNALGLGGHSTPLNAGMVSAAIAKVRLPAAVTVAVVSLAIFAVLLLLAGKDPLRAYRDTLIYVFGNTYGFSELLVRMTPLLLTAVAVALPACLGLINVGGEGQLYMGAWLATAGALWFPGLPAWLLLPLMTTMGFVGGALWALVPGVLRAARLVNETISTLLLNYVAPLIVSYFIFGPWRSAESASYPESSSFVDAAHLPSFFGTRIHTGLLYGLACLALYSLVMQRTRWGLEMRAIGGNPEASRRLGIPVSGYIIASMAVAGGIAGVAGMAEVSAIQGRLVAGLSSGYGFMGFLIAWLAGNSASGIVVMALLFAVVSSIGDILQITQGVPYAVVNVLMAVILFLVLGKNGGPGGGPTRRAA
jgi:simple sugar transport system permease protein